MTELVEFLRARYDERERVARAVAERSWLLRTDRDYPTPDTAYPDYTLWLGDRMASEVGFDEGEIRPSEAEHIADNDPAYVLADLDAKRRILDEHFESMLGDTGIGAGDCTTCMNYAWPCPTVRLQALPFAGHPDYRSEWAVAK